MKESAKIALSYVRGHAHELQIPDDAFEEREFHIHVPAGAIPKDGPSAGVTMVTALASLLGGRPVRHTVGMTGEITLQGRVLPIGGLKQKALAAHAAGLTDVVIPERNRGDLDEIPQEVRDAVRFNEFGEAVVGISPRMLAARLRDLEHAGMIERNVIPDSPPGVEYRLTERGRALAPIVAALRQYAAS